MRTLFAVLFAITIGGGCGDSGGGGGMDAGNGPPPDMTVFPMACTGKVEGYIAGTFDCSASMSIVNGEWGFNFAPANFIGAEQPKQLLLDVVSPTGFVPKTYRLSELSGTTLTLSTQLSERYLAANDGSSVTPGAKFSFTLYTVPVQPPGEEMWVDKNTHGLLDATLPLDPDSQGTKGTTVIVHAAW